MKKYAIMGILLLMLMLGTIHFAVAAQDNGASEVAIAGDITPTEVLMEINCTWSHGYSTKYVFPALIGWYDSNTLPPLPNMGWGNEILSIYVVQPMYVDISVTDVFAKGDYFEVYEVNGVHPTTANLIGTTPQVPVVGGSVTNPDVAFVDPTYSHDTFRVLLQSGKHYFAFRQVLQHYGSGAFYAKFCPGPTVGAVGGNIMPVNRLVAGTPYVALVGVFGAVLIVVATKKRKL